MTAFTAEYVSACTYTSHCQRGVPAIAVLYLVCAMRPGDKLTLVREVP